MLPSVTQILSPWTDFSGVPPAVLANAASRGSRIHAACAAYAMNYPVDGLEDEDWGYFESFKRWFDATVAEVITVETEHRDAQYGFMGHPDAVVSLKNSNDIWVIDWKTPRNLSKTYRLQIAAYCYLTQAKRGAILRLSPEGKKAILNENTDLSHDLSVFLNCLSAYKFFNE